MADIKGQVMCEVDASALIFVQTYHRKGATADQRDETVLCLHLSGGHHHFCRYVVER